MEFPEIVAVHPAGPEALVGIDGKKKPPGTQPYHTLPIGEVAFAASVNERLYVYGPAPRLEMIPLATWPCALADVAPAVSSQTAMAPWKATLIEIPIKDFKVVFSRFFIGLVKTNYCDR